MDKENIGGVGGNTAESLTNREEKYRIIAENTTDAIWIYNLTKMKYSYMSPSIWELRGYTQEEAMSNNFADSMTPESYEIVKEKIAHAVPAFLKNPSARQRDVTEVQLYCKNGSLLWAEVSTQLHLNSSGEIEIIGISRNIDHRKKAEMALCESEEKIRAIANSARDAIIMIDTEGSISYWNPAAELIFGYASEEVMGRNLHQLLAPQRYQARHQSAFSKFRLTGKGKVIGATTEAEACHKNGHEFPIELSLSAMHFHNGWHAVGVVRDITERKKMEAKLISQTIDLEQKNVELISSEARYRALADQSSEALALVDIETQEVVEINRQFTEMLGYSLPEDAPLYLNRFVEYSKKEVEKLFDNIVNSEGALPLEARIYRHKNGIEVPVERIGRVVRLDQKAYLLGSLRDMTKERQRQEEMVRGTQFASRVQRELLPVVPDSPYVTIRTIYHSLDMVSGDSYYLEWLNERKLLRGFLIDVTGHGLATALQTASLNVLLRETSVATLTLEEQLHQIDSRAAKYFSEGSYAAILGFEFDFQKWELRYIGAGITQFFCNGKKIETPGMFVGMFGSAEFGAGVLPIAEDDCIYFLTDGFTDKLSQSSLAFWSPDGKDFEADVAALEKVVEDGDLHDDATGLCFRINARNSQ